MAVRQCPSDGIASRFIAATNNTHSYMCCRLAQKSRNPSGDEIANVNFFYDDIVHVLQNKKENLLRLAN